LRMESFVTPTDVRSSFISHSFRIYWSFPADRW
jgi:hypothetical protein